jgi:hypothetical protein
MENKYYIYFHINPLNNEIFYVGKGHGKRAFDKKNRNRFWKFYTKKYNYIIDIIEDNLSEEQAFEREIFYINKIGRRDLGDGPLVNLTNGGEGPSGTTHNLGKVRTPEQRLKYSQCNIGKRKGSENHSSIYVKYNDIEYECLKDLWFDKFNKYSYSYFTMMIKKDKIENLTIISDVRKYKHKNHYRSKKLLYDNSEYDSLDDLRKQKFKNIPKSSFLRWCKNGKIQIEIIQ